MFTAAGFAKALAYWKLFLQGVVCTVCLSFLTVLFGFLLALLITGMRMSDFRPFRALALTRDGHERDEGFLAKLSRFNPIRFIASVYVELFRATPMVVQIMLVYYGLFNGVKVLPGFMLFGFIRFERFFPGVVALALNSGAYLSEIIRSGIQSIDGGQTEASRSLGMSKLQTMRFIILPQAIRNILPSVGNELIVNIKDSSVLNVISVSELFFQAKSAAGTYYRYFEVYFIIAVIYLILTLSVSAILRAVEKKMDGPDNYVIHGSQSDSRANIKVSVENEKEAVKRWNV